MNNKNISILKAAFFIAAAGLLASGCSDTKVKDENAENRSERRNEENATPVAASLTEAEKSEGWEYLFDGENTGKWRGVKEDNFLSNGWAIEEGALVLSGKGGGDIITREEYKDFELVLDFKLTDSANSGVKYFVGKMNNKDKEGQTIFNGPEYQIIDDYNHPAVTDDEKGNLISTGALYLLYVPENKKLNPAGEWNTARIIAKGKNVEHWLNGVKLLSYERGTEDFRQRVAKTKFKNQGDYGELGSGHILLTDHSDKVYFKNIKVRRL